MPDNREAVRRVFEEVWSDGNLDALDELVAPDCVDHDPQNPFAGTRGPEAVKSFASTYRAGFPDLSLTIEAMYEDGDVVITRWTGTGTHQGDLPGLPATGKRATVGGITIDRFEGGKVAEHWGHWDTLGMLQQLGAVPTPDAATAT